MISATALLLVAGCSPIIDNRGHKVDPVDLQALTPGVSTEEDVRAVLGSPSTEGTFDEHKWYYVGQNVERFAFLAPQVTDRQVVEVRFAEDGTLESIKQLGLEDGVDVDIVSRTTPTRGREMGFFEQMFGNIGRFTEDSDS